MPPPPRLPALRRRPRSERLLAWVYTGPLGHLSGAVADVAEVAGAVLLRRARARLLAARAAARARLLSRPSGRGPAAEGSEGVEGAGGKRQRAVPARPRGEPG